ncbi:hypothetical protein N7470_004403 [Penicillium chermesinum]|nr:hypothetical protein N7470_004403 [Penicillium chermesinum]
MASRNRSPMHIPIRTSSRANHLAPANGMETQANSESNYLDRNTSKAQRILGTDFPIPSNSHSQRSQSSSRWEKPRSRRSSVRTPDSSRQPPNTMSATPLSTDRIAPPQSLRVRASSPLLGQEYTSQDAAPPVPRLSTKKLQHIQNEWGVDPQVTYKQAPIAPQGEGVQKKITPTPH